jgi:hypothetical protein
VLPILKYIPTWFPFAQFRRDAQIWSLWADEMLNKPFEAAKCQIVGTPWSDQIEGQCTYFLQNAGVESPSLMYRAIQELADKPHSSDQETTLRNVAATMYAGLYSDIPFHAISHCAIQLEPTQYVQVSADISRKHLHLLRRRLLRSWRFSWQ